MLLPIRRSLANLGLYSETLGKTNPFKIIGINKSDLETGLVGIEYESNFTPTGVQIRKLKDFLIEQKLIKEVADNVDLLNCIKKNIFQDISEIMVNEYPKTEEESNCDFIRQVSKLRNIYIMNMLGY